MSGVRFDSKVINLRIAVLTFSILALELALIRWSSGQIRIFAYFNNIVLIGAFLGLGLGTALGRNGRSLLQWTLPCLAVSSVPLAFSEPLHLMRMAFPDPSVSLWGGEIITRTSFPTWMNLTAFVVIWTLIVLVFVFAGSELGRLFSLSAKNSLSAYASDLFGSLLGILAFTLLNFFDATPPFWLLVGGVPLAVLTPSLRSVLALALVSIMGGYSIDGAIYSPYNRIDLTRTAVPGAYELAVNRDFHQYIHNFNPDALNTLPEDSRAYYAERKGIYDFPFELLRNGKTAVIVGAGTGNDAAAAIRNGYTRVAAVDIDPRLIQLGEELHPDKPYSSPAVSTVVEDARAYFAQYSGPPVDLVVYGLLDSHAMVSSMSTLRVDNFVYTEEGLRSAWRHVADRGMLSVSFSVFAGQWIADRLFWTLYKATGVEPLAFYHGMHYGATYIVARDADMLDRAVLTRFPTLNIETPLEFTRTTSDDWPFLYVRPNVFPRLYVLVLGIILLSAAISVFLVFGGRELRSDFDPVMFLLGAGFLLLETRGVTALSLLFGSTWVVNSAIFGGILLMALLATLLVKGRHLASPYPWFVLLIVSCAFLWSFDLDLLNKLPLVWRGFGGGLIHALPLFFAGIIFPILLVRSRNPAAALGSNLLGAVLGGCLEYLSIAVGLKAVVLLALLMYLGALFLWRRGDLSIRQNV